MRTVGATGTHLRESQRGWLAWFLGALTSTTAGSVLLGIGPHGCDLTAAARWLWPRS